jgi:ABC-type sugar transport system ATPase subunit
MNFLEMRGIQKRFGDVHALSDADQDPFGVYAKDAGTIRLAGAEYALGSPRAAVEAGFSVVQQHPEFVGDLNGAENIFLSQEHARSGLFSPVNHQDIRTRAARLLERFPIEIDLEQRVEDMAAVDREIVCHSPRTASEQCPRADPRRADLHADRTREGVALRDDAHSAHARFGDHLHHPSPR